jgi:hypothetical protein
MSELIDEATSAGESAVFENRYFISVNPDQYIDGMLIAFSKSEADVYEALSLTELTKEVFESVGQDCQYIDGIIVKGPPMITTLTTEAKQAILSARMRDASEKIQTLQDAESLGMATTTESAELKAWQKYRVLLSRVDPGTQPPEEWPQQPQN